MEECSPSESRAGWTSIPFPLPSCCSSSCFPAPQPLQGARRIEGGSVSHRCPHPMSLSSVQGGCPGTLLAAGVVQAAHPPTLPTAMPVERSPASRGHGAKWVSSREQAAPGAAPSPHSAAGPWAVAVTQQQEEPNQN